MEVRIIMSLPIKETPILRGEDARRFREQVEKNKSKPVSREEYGRAKKTYDELKRKNKLIDF